MGLRAGYIGRECYAADSGHRRRRAAALLLRDGALMTAIKVPPLGESIVEATVSRWVKKEGDAVAAGDTLVELETDKITVEGPALSAGGLAKQVVPEGAGVKVDELLGELQEGDGAVASPKGEKTAPSKRTAQAREPAREEPAAPKSSITTKGSPR